MKLKPIDLFTTIVSLTRKLSLSTLLLILACSSAWSEIKVKSAEISGNPIVDEDKIKVRVKVMGTDDKPMVELQPINFRLIVDGQPLEFRKKDWKRPGEAKDNLPPAYIIVLLDFSDSMLAEDMSKTTKLKGAIKAIREFDSAAAERGTNTRISIVRFGAAGGKCEGYPLKKENFDNFFQAGDIRLKNYLDFLENEKPCATTNINEAVTNAVKYLNNSSDPRFVEPEDPSKPQPRLGIILLSDGFDNQKQSDRDFNNLISLLKSIDNITIHTLGYGLTPEQLGNKYKLGRAATRQDVWSGDLKNLPKGKVHESEFVDQESLKTIANTTGGISEFSANAQTVADRLQVFLNAFLGEYEISYIEPNSERGSRHEIQVAVKASEGDEVISPGKKYTIEVFGRSVPVNIRLGILVIVLLAIVGGGIIPFRMWSERLKEETDV